MGSQFELDLGKDETPFNEVPSQILSFDGSAAYFGKILDSQQSEFLFHRLQRGLPWASDEVLIYGRTITTERKVAWFGNKPYAYKYSGTTRIAKAWTSELLEIKAKVEEVSGNSYNSCLANLYENGKQGVGWHSDAEQELKKQGSVASVSLGAQRRFDFRHRTTRQKISINLENGSLLIMSGTIQTHWQHQLPKMLKIDAPRINLTFRQINEVRQ